MSEILKRRGDTKPFAYILWEDKKAGLRLNLAGYAFKFTVDPNIDPATSDNNIFSLDGVITDEANGEMQFEPTAVQMDITPDTYYYDIQITDPDGKIETKVVDKFIVKQDITK